MTTYVDFAPLYTQAFSFQPVLDGQTYTCIVTWNLFGQRWYINLYDVTNALIVCTPLIASPNDYDINLVGGYFTTSTMVFREANQQFEVSP